MQRCDDVLPRMVVLDFDGIRQQSLTTCVPTMYVRSTSYIPVHITPADTAKEEIASPNAWARELGETGREVRQECLIGRLARVCGLP